MTSILSTNQLEPCKSEGPFSYIYIHSPYYSVITEHSPPGETLGFTKRHITFTNFYPLVGSTHNFTIGRLTSPASVRTVATRTLPSEPGWMAMILPIFQS